MAEKILVSGGAGYIGSHTVVELLQHGFEVVIVDDLSNSSEAIIQQIAQITGKESVFEKFNLCDKEKTRDFFQRHPDLSGAIHFAAHKAVGESVHKPLKYYSNNLVSLFNILECMDEKNIRNFVFSSSCTVYGEPDTLPVKESNQIKPAISPYGNTKQIAEEILLDVTKASHLNCISLRYFNPIGAHESGLIGELPIGTPQNLVPYITQTAIGKREMLQVFGDDYSTPDGTCIRDYIHVVDLAQAHVHALNRLLKNKCKAQYEVFNLGTGNGYSVKEVIHAFENISGKKLNYRIAARREGDVEKVWADTSYANKELGWKAEKDLNMMMSTAWLWEQNLAKGIIKY